MRETFLGSSAIVPTGKRPEQGMVVDLSFQTLDIPASGDLGRFVNPSFGNWSPEYAREVHELEKKAWPPGLRRPLNRIQTIAKDYPQTQFLGTAPDGTVITAITAKRIELDGPNPLDDTHWQAIKWDKVAGGSIDDGDYKEYDREGKGLCFMSAAVHPEYRGQDLGLKTFAYAIGEAKTLGIEWVVAPMRPSRWGKERKTSANPVSFEEYVLNGGSDGRRDPWLQVAESLGMRFLGIVEESMTVEVTTDTLKKYTSDPYFEPTRFNHVPYYGTTWTGGPKWDYGDTGFWVINGHKAVYTEPNAWYGGAIGNLKDLRELSNSLSTIPNPR